MKPLNLQSAPVLDQPAHEGYLWQGRRISARLNQDWLADRRILYALIALITMTAGVLRFYKLGAWSFWGDEMLTVIDVPDGFNFSWIRQSLAISLIQIAINGLGTSEWSARLIPALIGMASVPLLYYPTRRIFGRPVALAAILFLALSPWHLYWSQNARFYTLLLLFYTLALLTFYIGLEEDRPLYLVASLIFLGLAARERLVALVFVPVLFSYLTLLYLLPLGRPRGLRWRNLAIFGIPIAVVGLFFAGPYLSSLSGWMAGFGRINNNPFWLLAGFVYYIGIGTVCVAFVGALGLLLRRDRAGLLLALNTALPILLLMGISLFHYTANRYAFISLYSALILAAWAVVFLIQSTPNSTRVLAVAVLIYLLASPLSQNLLYFRYQNGNRDDWRAAVAVVQQHKHEGDLVFGAHPDLTSYYLGEPAQALHKLDLDKVKSAENRIWLIQDMNVAEVRPDIEAWLQREPLLISVHDVNVQARNFKMRVYLYEPVGITR
ncbi:MAG: glycosyltransferase family 39 protein [Caldilineaceae bacterium]|nr:glycosyltransferase family 39 protein [Caldilineaceae bacterium]